MAASRKVAGLAPGPSPLAFDHGDDVHLLSSTIAARAREPEGLRKMMFVPAIAHSLATSSDRRWAVDVRREPAAGNGDGGQLLVRRAGRRHRRHDGAVGQGQKAEPKPHCRSRRPSGRPRPRRRRWSSRSPSRRRPNRHSASRRRPPSRAALHRRTVGWASRGSRRDRARTKAASPPATGGASNQGNVNFCDPQYLGQMVSRSTTTGSASRS